MFQNEKNDIGIRSDVDFLRLSQFKSGTTSFRRVDERSPHHGRSKRQAGLAPQKALKNRPSER